MTEARRRATPASSVLEAREAVVAGARGEGAHPRRASPTSTPSRSRQRSGERIEPLISLQWFMRMDELAAPAIEVVRDGRVRIHPESQSRRYVDWLENIRPWCISRQLWWGHQIPVWYRGDETYVGHRAARGRGLGARPRRARHVVLLGAVAVRHARLARRHARAARLLPDRRALDGARHPLPLGRADGDDGPASSPATSRSTDVYVHSVIQAPDGRRMSKSLGTGIDPLDEIEVHGADAVRFGLLAMSSTQDVRYRAEKVAQGQALANKLFNASRFVLLQGRREDADAGAAAGDGRGPLDPLAAAARRRPPSPRASTTSTSPKPRSGSTTSSTASCATGTSSWSRAASFDDADAVGDAAARPAARRSRSRTR